jgi:hypothetical protein
LTAGTGETVSTCLTIWGAIILGTNGRVAGTFLFRITLASVVSTDGIGRSEFAVLTAVLVGVITYSSVGKFAGLGIATFIAPTSFFPATVTIFTFLNDAISTLAPRDGYHTPVI